VRALIAMNGHLLEVASATNLPGALTEAKLRAVMAAPNPVSLKATFAGRKPVPSGFNFSLPGILVMYLMMNLLIFGGATVAAERRNGVIKRLMVHPVTSLELVMGKIYGLMLLGVVQIIFFLAVGKFLFHVNLGANLPAVTLTLLVFAWVAGSLGVLVAAGGWPAGDENHFPLSAIGLGVAGVASTHQLWQRFRRGAAAASRTGRVWGRGQSPGRPLLPELSHLAAEVLNHGEHGFRTTMVRRREIRQPGGRRI